MVSVDDVKRAAARIRGIVHRTPVLTSCRFNERAGLQTVFKCENFQRSGSFKFRGASNFLHSIPVEDLPRGVVAYSSGNHGQAVALAASELKVPATIVMPLDAPPLKLGAAKGYGAKVITYDRFKEDREAIGRSLATETGATLVPPYDHEWIVAGAGTAALELFEDEPHLDAFVVCVGGGGLLAGSSLAARHSKPSIRIFGVEPELGNDTFLSFGTSERVKIAPPETVADGLRTVQPGAITFPILQKHLEAILLVSDSEILETVEFLRSRMKMVVEPSGAVAAAAVLYGKLPAGIRTVGVLISGGNC